MKRLLRPNIQHGCRVFRLRCLSCVCVWCRRRKIIEEEDGQSMKWWCRHMQWRLGGRTESVYKAIERERLSVFGWPQSSSWFYARERKKEYKKSMGIVLVELYICLQTVGSDTGLFSLLYRFRLHAGCNGERGSSLGPSLWMTNHCPCACAAHTWCGRVESISCCL